MKNQLVTLLFVVVSTASWAENSVFKEYRVAIHDEATVPVRLPQEKVESLRAALLNFTKELSACESAHGQYHNPMINRQSQYTLTKGVAGCALSLNSWSTWRYECQLSTKAREVLARGMKKRVLTDALLGDYSLEEKSVLFDKLICSAEQLTD